MAKKNKTCYINVGGQALIEGVMMRSPDKTVMAVRNNEGKVILEDVPLKKRGKIFKFFSKVPIVRGVLSFPTSIALGYKSLMRSAELSGLEDILDEGEPSKFEKWLDKVTKGNIMKLISWISVFLSLILCAGIFVFLPGFLAKQIGLLFMKTAAHPNFDTVVTIIHAFLKIGVFVAYLALCTCMKDIRRTLMYHGAEHKSIHCLEAGKELTVENVKSCSRFHPRCSTSFLFVMMVFSILFFVLLQEILPFVNWDNLWLRYLINIAVVPIVMGVGFEIIKLLNRFDNWFTKILAAPGLSMQFFTTKEPDEAQIEVAISSLLAALDKEVPNFDRPIETAEDKPSDETDCSENDTASNEQNTSLNDTEVTETSKEVENA